MQHSSNRWRAAALRRMAFGRCGYSNPMTIGGSIFLIAVGAILKFATNFHVAHVNVDTVGVILMIAGAVGLLIGLYLEVVRPRSRRDVVYQEREPPLERREPPARY